MGKGDEDRQELKQVPLQGLEQGRGNKAAKEGMDDRDHDVDFQFARPKEVDDYLR